MAYTTDTVSRVLFEPATDDMECDDLKLDSFGISLPFLMEDEDSGLGMDLLDNSYTLSMDATQTDNKPEPKEADSILFSQSLNDFGIQSHRGHKRPAAAENECVPSTKRQRSSLDQCLPRSFSFGDTPRDRSDMKEVVNRLVEESDLIADGSQSYCLPTIPGKHPDLKSITNDVVADLLAGKYDDVVGSYQLIHCRYPYEYDGGHIKGAVNICKENGIPSILQRRPNQDNKRNILIFYCEFSSERGPKMYRNVRSADRTLNKDRYPYLNYPEIYLIHNGYKAFYEAHREFCVPDSYTPMLDKAYSSDLRHFRSKSKSWSGGFRRCNGGQRLVF